MDSAVDLAFKAVCLVEANVRGSDERFAYTEDDIPVCTCKLADDAEQGCEEGSINRSMRFECVVELCPCGEHSSNRQLQLGSTFVTAVVDCGGKGVGVITREDVKLERVIKSMALALYWRFSQGVINKPQQTYLLVSRVTTRQGLIAMAPITAKLATWSKPPVRALQEEKQLQHLSDITLAGFHLPVTANVIDSSMW
ncbi:hypothetical protein F442_04624 [Phytophthora nicotianae P10297]|uniref:AWS domain-containing protein n=1 Tax=Phytophthora nicotianae P10297 TaxID=1317064 RepID=W2ZRH5_PHYNI|nr:hypothetical protein F442_04624 [Phytophthora nicotianae P10297]